jgi:hypothetical protein
MTTSRRSALRVVLLLAALALGVAPAAAQKSAGDYALIFGTVWDGTRPVYGVHVRLRRAAEKRFRWEATSDHRGEFGIRVPVGEGDYVAVAEVKRPKGAPLPQKSIHIDGNERQDIGFHLDRE